MALSLLPYSLLLYSIIKCNATVVWGQWYVLKRLPEPWMVLLLFQGEPIFTQNTFITAKDQFRTWVV